MKKFFILALFVLGMYNASAFAMAQEIILTELYSIVPLDDPKRETLGGRPNPNLIIATIDGDQLSIDAGADEHAYIEVVDPETGEVIADEEFVGETTMSITEDGDFELYIYTNTGTVLMGEFVVK